MTVMYEQITPQDLYREEIELVEEHRTKLIERGDEDSLRAAENLEHVIRYFRARIEAMDDYEEVQTRTIH